MSHRDVIRAEIEAEIERHLAAIRELEHRLDMGDRADALLALVNGDAPGVEQSSELSEETSRLPDADVNAHEHERPYTADIGKVRSGESGEPAPQSTAPTVTCKNDDQGAVQGAVQGAEWGDSLPGSPLTAPSQKALTSENVNDPSMSSGGRVTVADSDSPLPPAPSAPSAPWPPGFVLALVDMDVRDAGGSLALTPAEWADRLNVRVSDSDNPALPGNRDVAFSRWFLNDIPPEVWAATGLVYRRKTVRGRRLVEIALEDDDV